MYRFRYNIDTHYKLPLSSGQPTKVEFHVTVMSLDSINEGSMVSNEMILQ